MALGGGFGGVPSVGRRRRRGGHFPTSPPSAQNAAPPGVQSEPPPSFDHNIINRQFGVDASGWYDPSGNLTAQGREGWALYGRMQDPSTANSAFGIDSSGWYDEQGNLTQHGANGWANYGSSMGSGGERLGTNFPEWVAANQAPSRRERRQMRRGINDSENPHSPTPPPPPPPSAMQMSGGGSMGGGRASGAGLSRGGNEIMSGPGPASGFGRIETGPAPAPPSGPPFDPRSLPPSAGRGPFAPGTTVYAPWGNNGQIENVPHVIGSGPGSYGNPGGNTPSTFPRPPAPGGPTMSGGPAPAPAPRPYPLPAPGADPSSAMQQSFMQFLQSGGR